MLDQVLLSNSYVDYAVRGCTAAHNATYATNGASALTHVTGRRVDLTRHFLWPYGTPLAVMDHSVNTFRFQPTAVYGISLGSVDEPNGGTLVVIPGQGPRPYVRRDVRDLKMCLRQMPELEKEALVS